MCGCAASALFIPGQLEFMIPAISWRFSPKGAIVASGKYHQRCSLC